VNPHHVTQPRVANIPRAVRHASSVELECRYATGSDEGEDAMMVTGDASRSGTGSSVCQRSAAQPTSRPRGNCCTRRRCMNVLARWKRIGPCFYYYGAFKNACGADQEQSVESIENGRRIYLPQRREAER